MSKFELMVEPKSSEIRRVEVISGTGRRRTFSEDEKLRILEETLAPGAVVSAVARRHGLTPQQLFTWRRSSRRRAAREEPTPAFVPAIMGETQVAPGSTSPTQSQAGGAAIEIELGTAHVWLWNGADANLAMAVVRALKALT